MKQIRTMIKTLYRYTIETYDEAFSLHARLWYDYKQNKGHLDDLNVWREFK